jgi:hypothetical protein
LTLSASNPQADITVPLGAFFNQDNLTGTFRLLFGVAQQDSNPVNPSNLMDARIDWRVSDSFNVVVIPTALVQLKTMPYAIVYAPPGDQSTVTFTTQNGYMTSFTVGNSQGTSNKSMNEQSSSTKDSFTIGYKYAPAMGSKSVSGDASGSGSNPGLAGASAMASFTSTGADTWDTTTTYGVATTNGKGDQGTSSISLARSWPIPIDYSLTPGSGVTCANPDCSTLTTPNPVTVYFNEPFWNDRFVMIVHPQFAAWVLYGNSQGQPQATIKACGPRSRSGCSRHYCR